MKIRRMDPGIIAPNRVFGVVFFRFRTGAGIASSWVGLGARHRGRSAITGMSLQGNLQRKWRECFMDFPTKTMRFDEFWCDSPKLNCWNLIVVGSVVSWWDMVFHQTLLPKNPWPIRKNLRQETRGAGLSSQRFLCSHPQVLRAVHGHMSVRVAAV